MQTITLILLSIMAALFAPLIILAFSAYTLYNTITLAKVAKRRHGDLLKAAVLARHRTKSLKKLKSIKAPKLANGSRHNGTRNHGPRNKGLGNNGFKNVRIYKNMKSPKIMREPKNKPSPDARGPGSAKSVISLPSAISLI